MSAVGKILKSTVQGVGKTVGQILSGGGQRAPSPTPAPAPAAAPTPTPTPTPTPPATSTIQQNVEGAKRRERRRSGRASTMLTDERQYAAPRVGTSALLGE